MKTKKACHIVTSLLIGFIIQSKHSAATIRMVNMMMVVKVYVLCVFHDLMVRIKVRNVRNQNFSVRRLFFCLNPDLKAE